MVDMDREISWMIKDLDEETKELAMEYLKEIQGWQYFENQPASFQKVMIRMIFTFIVKEAEDPGHITLKLVGR